MATVGECTEQAYKILKQKNHVKYELNSGGHFADSGKRLAKAVRFLAEKGERSEHKIQRKQWEFRRDYAIIEAMK